MLRLRRFSGDLLPPAVLAAFLALYYGPGVFGGQLYLAEDLSQFFAFRSVLYHLAHGAQPSLWDELPGLGIPRLANAQMGYLSPFSLWFYLVPTARAMSLEPALLLFAVGVSTYGFLRVSGLPPGASSFGTLAWLGVGAIVGHVQNPNILECLVWLPASLACWTKFRQRLEGRWAAAGGVAMAFMVYAGHPQYLLYSSVIVVGWMAADLWGARSRRSELWRLAGGAAGMAVLGLLLGSLQLLPVAELGARSQRHLLQGTRFADQFRATPGELARYLAAESLLVGEWPRQVHGGYPVYSGVSVLAVAFALYGAWRDRRLRGPMAGAALFALGMLGSEGPVMGVLGRLPLAGLVRAPVRMLVPSAFLLAWAAAWGFHLWTRGLPPRLRAWAPVAASAWLLGLWWILNHGSVRWVAVEEVLPPEPVLTMSEGRMAPDVLSLPPLLVNSGLAAGVPSLIVWDPVVPRNWFEAMFASQLGSLRQREKVDLAISVGSLFPLTRPDLPLMRSFDLRRVVRLREGRFVGDPVPAAGGRFFVASEPIVAPSDEDRWARAADDGWDPLREALVARPFPAGDGRPGRVEVLRDHPDAQDLQVDGGGGLLVVSGLFYPGWSVTVDGSPGEVVEANLALRGVAVPPGPHVVQWRYRPGWLRPALACAALGFLVAVALIMGLPGGADEASRAPLST